VRVVKGSGWMRRVAGGDPEGNTGWLSRPIWGGEGEPIVSASVQWICLHCKGVDEMPSLAKVQAVQSNEPVGGGHQFCDKGDLGVPSIEEDSG